MLEAEIFKSEAFAVLAFGLPALGVLLLNAIAKPRSDAAGVSLVLLMLWAGAMIIRSLGVPPTNMTMLVVLDLIGGLTLWLCNRAHPRPWKRLLGWTFIASICVHTAMWAVITWFPDLNKPEVRNLFTFARNLIFYTQLVFSAWPGGLHVARRLRSLLSRHSAGGVRVGAEA